MSDPAEPPSSVISPHPAHVALAFAAIYVIWGSTYLAIRVAVETMPPFLMAGVRFVIAGAIMFVVLRARGVPSPAPGEWARSALAGALMLTVGNGLVTWAEQSVPSNLAALLVAAVPLYVALIDWARPAGTRPRPRVMLGIAVGAIGMVLLLSRTGGDAHGATAGGVVAVLLAGLGWAMGSLYTRYAGRPAHPAMGSAEQMIAGGAALLIIGGVRGEAHGLRIEAISLGGALAFVYLTLFGSMIAFTLFGWLVKVSTPARLSTTAYINPLVAVVLGWVVLDERLSAAAALGAAFIVLAVFMMTGGPAWFRAGRPSLLRPR